MSKISGFTDGGRGLFGDEVVSERSGANRKHDLEDLAGYLTIGHPRRRMPFFDDFLGETTTNAGALLETNNGTGANSSPISLTQWANHPGVLVTDTGSTATGRAAVTTDVGALILGGGAAVYEVAIRIPDLSTAGERFQLVLGFLDGTGAVDQTDAIAFVYDEGGVSAGSAASANWQVVTASNSTRTWTTTGTAVAEDTWIVLRIEVNAAADSVEFFIDDTSVATHTTNIPSGTGRAVGFGWVIFKSVGTTERSLQVDYLACEIDFSTAR